MKEKKDFSLMNCIATSLLAIFFTIPVHELFHAITDLAYGDTVICFSAGAVLPGYTLDYSEMPVFHRIMVAGGSASIINAIIGIILIFVVLRVNMRPMLRLFLIQLMGCHLTEGIGYFLIGGLFGAGDWGWVFNALDNRPDVITPLRIVLIVVGAVGIVGLFFLLNYMSYYFIEDKTNLKERVSVAFKLHLLMLIIGFTWGMVATAISPAKESGELNLGIGLLYNMMWIPFFWGFMFTGVMKTLPPKESRFLYKLPAKPNFLLLGVGIVLLLFDIIVLGPGIWFN